MSSQKRADLRCLTWLLPLTIGCGNASDSDTADNVIVSAGQVTLNLVNPTLNAPNPLEGIQTLRIDVTVDGDVITTDSFDYPEESPEFVGLDEFGVLRFEIAGLSGGQVRSFGRSAETVVEPGETLDIDVTFLPINEVFSLDTTAYEKRSDHVAKRLLNGQIALIGGHNANRNDSYDSIGFFDPVTKTYSPSLIYMEASVGSPRVFLNEDGELVIVGGSQLLGPTNETASNLVQVYDPAANTVNAVATMGYGRSEHCVARYLNNAFAAIGGPGTGDWVDIVKPDTSGPDAWTVTTVRLDHPESDTYSLEAAHSCGVFEDGTIFIQGQSGSTTGLWDLVNAGSTPGQTFSAHANGQVNYVKNAVVWPIAEESMWIAGGVDVSTGEVTNDASEFQLDTMQFVSGQPLSVARQHASVDPWIEDNWLVVGCGYDDTVDSPVGSVELIAPRTGSTGFTADLDRTRPGCQVTTLLDGTVLITGGYAPEDLVNNAADAAIMVPYVD